MVSLVLCWVAVERVDLQKQHKKTNAKRGDEANEGDGFFQHGLGYLPIVAVLLLLRVGDVVAHAFDGAI